MYWEYNRFGIGNLINEQKMLIFKPKSSHISQNEILILLSHPQIYYYDRINIFVERQWTVNTTNWFIIKESQTNIR